MLLSRRLQTRCQVSFSPGFCAARGAVGDGQYGIWIAGVGRERWDGVCWD